MGSNDEERYVTVLVTGFEAFQAKYPINPSFEIASLLPSTLESSSGRRQIRVILHKPPVRVVYETTKELIPRLLKAYQDQIDLVLHIGMASGRKTYTIEKYAHRDGYDLHEDLNGEKPGKEHISDFCDCPERMTTSLDYDRLWEDWLLHADEIKDQKLPLSRSDLCKSEDAGHFLCDYIYLNSLAFYARQQSNDSPPASVTNRPVMFFHVPGESDTQTITRGTVAATALIRAMADQMYE